MCDICHEVVSHDCSTTEPKNILQVVGSPASDMLVAQYIESDSGHDSTCGAGAGCNRTSCLLYCVCWFSCAHLQVATAASLARRVLAMESVLVFSHPECSLSLVVLTAQSVLFFKSVDNVTEYDYPQ